MKMPEVKQVEAQSRQAEATKMTTVERIARLDKALGKGVGAAKERAKLAKRLSAELAEASKNKKN